MNKCTVQLEEKYLDITTMEFEVMALFARNPGKVLTRDRIMERTHNMDWEAYNRTVDVLISRLRQKLGDDPKKPDFIKTVWGTGYVFIAEESDNVPSL